MGEVTVEAGWQMMEWAGAQATVATIAIVLSVLSFAFTFYLDRQGHNRDNRIEKSQAYLQLELASIEVFKFKAAHWDALEWGETGANPLDAPEQKLREEADAFFYQCLNLFEVASRYRQAQVIHPEIYASWVAWFFETLEYTYFRRQWQAEYRDNYTTETREIFDRGVALDWQGEDDNALRKAFYIIVADATDCDQIRQWRVAVPEAPQDGAARPPAAPAPAIEYVWDDGTLAEPAAAFAARVIGAQASYISHGEIQCGLATPDGKRWIADLEERYVADFAAHENREMLVARTADGAIVGLGILHYVSDAPRPYAVIEDMAIEPDLRSAGIGQELLVRLEQRAGELGCGWAFLESGLENEGAHRFFERHGFRTLSHVFGKQLPGPTAPVR